MGWATIETESSLADNELLNQFKAIEKMPEQDKDVAKTLIDAFITKKKLKQLVHKQQQPRPKRPGLLFYNIGITNPWIKVLMQISTSGYELLCISRRAGCLSMSSLHT